MEGENIALFLKDSIENIRDVYICKCICCTYCVKVYVIINFAI